MRRVIAALVVVGLAVGVALLWPRSDPDDTPDTVAAATTTTSTTNAETTTTSGNAPSTTFDDGTQVVETVEEAEAILRKLWFGWFEGIYNQDEDRIREVVILEETVETARDSFEVEFERAPQPEDITFQETEILRSDEGCLAVWSEMHLEGFRTGTSDGVYVLRQSDEGWKRLRTWIRRGDQWNDDCEGTLPS